ncbi:MAG: hypothetical protein ACRERV_18860, partial [Methylococcales bacterium]
MAGSFFEIFRRVVLDIIICLHRHRAKHTFNRSRFDFLKPDRNEQIGGAPQRGGLFFGLALP